MMYSIKELFGIEAGDEARADPGEAVRDKNFVNPKVNESQSHRHRRGPSEVASILSTMGSKESEKCGSSGSAKDVDGKSSGNNPFSFRLREHHSHDIRGQSLEYIAIYNARGREGGISLRLKRRERHFPATSKR